jgi:hypothetical protein
MLIRKSPNRCLAAIAFAFRFPHGPAFHRIYPGSEIPETRCAINFPQPAEKREPRRKSRSLSMLPKNVAEGFRKDRWVREM